MNSGLELRKFANVYTHSRRGQNIYFFSLSRKDGVFFCYKKNSYNILMCICLLAYIVEKKETHTVDDFFFSIYSLSNHTSYVWLDDSIVFHALS